MRAPGVDQEEKKPSSRLPHQIRKRSYFTWESRNRSQVQSTFSFLLGYKKYIFSPDRNDLQELRLVHFEIPASLSLRGRTTPASRTKGYRAAKDPGCGTVHTSSLEEYAPMTLDDIQRKTVPTSQRRPKVFLATRILANKAENVGPIEILFWSR